MRHGVLRFIHIQIPTGMRRSHAKEFPHPERARMALLHSPTSALRLPSPNPRSSSRRTAPHVLPLLSRRGHAAAASRLPNGRRSSQAPSPLPSASLSEALRRHAVLVIHLAAVSASAAVLLAGSGAHASTVLPPATTVGSGDHATETSELLTESLEDEELKAAFESWKKRTYALTVPLRIVALRSSFPPSWVKDFMMAQGRRLKLTCEYRTSLESIFSELSSVLSKGRVKPKSAMAADIASVGDSWLSYAIAAALVEPIQDAEEQDWFKSLNGKWKVYLCRNSKGELDTNGNIWGAPYRWGTMVIAYKKSKFQKHKLAPIEDWKDLWRPELAGRISMVDSPREVVGAVLKCLGASYNTSDIDSQVTGGRESVMHNLTLLQRQVRLFDSVQYLKAFGAGDVWIAVGWSSDVIPAAKRMSDVTVIVPKSGSSLWADLWAIPSATRFTTDQIGGRIRSPSPLIHQWIEFCLQSARGLPFQQEVIPGSVPSTLGHLPSEGPEEPMKGKPKLDTNLIDGRPPPEILARCEFLEPLSEKAMEDYRWLGSNMQKKGDGLARSILNHISSFLCTHKAALQSR